MVKFFAHFTLTFSAQKFTVISLRHQFIFGFMLTFAEPMCLLSHGSSIPSWPTVDWTTQPSTQVAFKSGQWSIQVFEHLVLWRFMWWAVQCSQLGEMPLMFVVKNDCLLFVLTNTLKHLEIFHRFYYMHKRRLNYEVEGRKLKEATCDSKTQLMTHI